MVMFQFVMWLFTMPGNHLQSAEDVKGFNPRVTTDHTFRTSQAALRQTQEMASAAVFRYKARASASQHIAVCATCATPPSDGQLHRPHVMTKIGIEHAFVPNKKGECKIN